MSQIHFTFLALFLPFFINPVKIPRKGLFTGLMLSLLYGCTVAPCLAIVPLFASFTFYYIYRNPRKNTGMSDSKRHLNLKHPATTVFVFFIVLTAVFFAISTAVISGTVYAPWGATHIFLSERLRIPAIAGGSIFFGWLCDRKSAFISALYLVFLSEMSLFFFVSGASRLSSHIISIYLISVCSGGMFVLLPMLTRWFWGETVTLRTYPLIAGLVFCLTVTIQFLLGRSSVSSAIYNELAVFLLALIAVSLVFLYVSWKRRFFIVTRRRIRR